MIDYLPKVSEQLEGLLYSVGIGFALWFVYEIIRLIFCLLSGNDKKFTLQRDIIFLLVALVCTFFFLIVRYNGKVMFFALLGEMSGGYLAFRLIDPFVYFIINCFIKKLRKNLSRYNDRMRRRMIVFVKKFKKT